MVPISEELQSYGISDKAYQQKRKEISGGDKSQAAQDNVVEALLQERVEQATEWVGKQVAYWYYAVFKDRRDQDSFKEQQLSHQCRINALEMEGSDKVQINASACCGECHKMHKKVLSTKVARLRLPIPSPKCKSRLNSEYIWCTTLYVPARADEQETQPPPPAVKDVPKPPELVAPKDGGGSGGGTLVQVRALGESVGETAKQISDYAGPAVAVMVGVALALFHLPAGLLLLGLGVLVIPQIYKPLTRLVPWLQGRLARFGLLLIGLLLVLLLLLLSEWVSRQEPEPKLKPLPAYSVESTEDRSISTRSRLKVVVRVTEPVTPQEMAQLAMRAAQDLQRSMSPDDPRHNSFEHLQVRVEGIHPVTGKPAVLSEAEFAPDGRGRAGVISSDPQNQWSWKVRVNKSGGTGSLEEVFSK
jgi:hypothetical protein